MPSPVPQFTRTLTALAAILHKAEAHAAAKKIDPAVILQSRLYPDMFTLTEQVQLACDFAARAAARLSGHEIRNFPDTETTFAEVQARIATALDYIASFPEADFTGADTRSITVKQSSGDQVMTGAAYLAHLSQPQFFFHVTAAYCILRSIGVDIGKRDFMGG
jgi:uncharacterized protein